MTNQNNSLSLESIYKIVRDYIVHEDNLINIRLNWLLVIQGLLFTGYGLSLRGSSNNTICKFQGVLIFLGISTCILVFLSIFTAFISIQNLEDFWREYIRDNPEILTRVPFIIGGADPKLYESNRRFRYLHKKQYEYHIAFSSPLLIPLIFLIAWIIILIP